MPRQGHPGASNPRPNPSGVHFLTATPVVDRLIQDCGIGPTDLVLDFGAGPGAVTARLARTGATVLAVERDAEFVRQLRQRRSRSDNVRVVPADIRTVPLSPPCLLSGGEHSLCRFHGAAATAADTTVDQTPPGRAGRGMGVRQTDHDDGPAESGSRVVGRAVRTRTGLPRPGLVLPPGARGDLGTPLHPAQGRYRPARRVSTVDTARYRLQRRGQARAFGPRPLARRTARSPGTTRL